MDCTYYKCETCGFVHQIPAYWSDFSPEIEMEMPHVNLETKEICEDITLKLLEQK